MTDTPRGLLIRGMSHEAAATHYAIPTVPVPGVTAGDSWCIIPFCAHDATTKAQVCLGHRRTMHRLGWTVDMLVAMELARFRQARRDCALASCPTGQKRNYDAFFRDAPRDSKRTRAYSPRRYMGVYSNGGVTVRGEYLCRNCAALASSVQDFDLDTIMGTLVYGQDEPLDFERWPGLAMQRRKPTADMDFLDGALPEQWAYQLAGYAYFWSGVAHLRQRFGAVVPPAEVITLREDATRIVYDAIEQGTLPSDTFPYRPNAIIVDAMYGFAEVCPE